MDFEDQYATPVRKCLNDTVTGVGNQSCVNVHRSSDACKCDTEHQAENPGGKGCYIRDQSTKEVEETGQYDGKRYLQKVDRSEVLPLQYKLDAGQYAVHDERSIAEIPAVQQRKAICDRDDRRHTEGGFRVQNDAEGQNDQAGKVEHSAQNFLHI